MFEEPVYKCNKCGWSGPDTNALFPMHPEPDQSPKCPKCLAPLSKVNEMNKGDQNKKEFSKSTI